MEKLLEKEEIKIVLEKLAEKIRTSNGVKACIKKRSRNFENWVQVELCDLLTREPFLISVDQIKVEQPPEKGSHRSVDVVVVNSSDKSLIGIEIKVMALGGPGGNIRSGVEKDEESLCILDSRQKILLWAIYEKKGHPSAIGKWEDYKPKTGLPQSPVVVFEKVKDGVDMIMYAHVL